MYCEQCSYFVECIVNSVLIRLGVCCVQCSHGMVCVCVLNCVHIEWGYIKTF